MKEKKFIQKFYTEKEEDTVKIGEKIAKYLKKGDIIGFIGELGSGKTTMIKGIVRYFSDSKVTSPSFVIINEYKGKIPIFHFDLYRIRKFEELVEIGWNDYLDNGILIIEWADKIKKNLPKNTILVKIDIVKEKKRKIIIKNLKIGGKK